MIPTIAATIPTTQPVDILNAANAAAQSFNAVLVAITALVVALTTLAGVVLGLFKLFHRAAAAETTAKVADAKADATAQAQGRSLDRLSERANAIDGRIDAVSLKVDPTAATTNPGEGPSSLPRVQT